MPPLTTSQSFSSTVGTAADYSPGQPDSLPVNEAPKYFFHEKYARLGVKGNFMPLAAQPKNVDLGEWLAHQSKCSLPPAANAHLICTLQIGIEQYRLIEGLLTVVQEVDSTTGLPICNERDCPVMSAGL